MNGEAEGRLELWLDSNNAQREIENQDTTGTEGVERVDKSKIMKRLTYWIKAKELKKRLYGQLLCGQ